MEARASLRPKQTAGTVLDAIAVVNRHDEALEEACAAATGHQRVFLFDNPNSRDCIEIDLAKPYLTDKHSGRVYTSLVVGVQLGTARRDGFR